MNPLIPIIFGVLGLNNPGDQADVEPRIELCGGAQVQMVAPVDSINEGNIKLVFLDVVADTGGSRRVLMTETAGVGPADIIDGGSWGAEGFIDRFYFTDHKGETLTGYYTVADARPEVSVAPEGGMIIELTDRVELDILNYDGNENLKTVIRDNQVRLKVDEAGKFQLISIRPKPNDLSSLTHNVIIYDTQQGEDDEVIEGSVFEYRLREILPIAGK